VVPDDLARALERRPLARAAFAKLNATNRYTILHRLQIAKHPETRARRIETFVTMLEASGQPVPRKAAAPTAKARR
jgi:uncharacterized protein YdeI (YjbR/CyaY-like superfamily)